MSQQTPTTITFYGAKWCPDCKVAKKFLDDHAVEYEYIDLELHEDAAAKVEEINNGYQSIPTIVFPNGHVLVEPSDEELAAELGIQM